MSPAEGILFYDKELDIDPYERLLVILHELGHLELHPRLRRGCTVPETLAGSMYLNDGAPSLARYNKHGREETEANSFAVEFLSPADELFEKFRLKPQRGIIRQPGATRRVLSGRVPKP